MSGRKTQTVVDNLVAGTTGGARGVVVTGAARGIGLAVARRLAADGLAVVGVDMAGSVVKAMREAGATAVVADVGQAEAMSEACRLAAENGAGLRTFVANAGVIAPGESVGLDLADWDRTVDTNLRAAFVGARTAAELMPAGGSIVMISSISASLGFGGRAAYCASKAGVEGLVRALAMEWGARGLRVNAVAPGATRTQMQASMNASGRTSDAAYLSRIPLNRLGLPEEIAAAVWFLASDEASYVTGAVLPVDGGWVGAGLPSVV
ncbi:SDR family NAD(P)-dependent oxidoreductase [Georgenia sp. AZ-5]|uniref:SDR family NAD(P)-dependent oxidoreductase n=1 Tax=Georgenia sp. AZ-5 TaxID=3367526 RepID=UPI0037553A71